jgi:ribosomal protein S18 acetylase RimI-like enzyme
MPGSRSRVDGDVPARPSRPDPPIYGVELRSAEKADIDDILAFWKLSAEDADRPADSREAIEELIARDPDALLLTTHGHKIVGCVIAGWDGWRAHLYRLAVHPDYRRQGLARWLLGAAEERLRRHRAIRFDAMVVDGNDSAHTMWSGLGYSRQEEWSRWVKPAVAQAPPSAAADPGR